MPYFFDLVTDDPLGRVEQRSGLHPIPTGRLERILYEVPSRRVPTASTNATFVTVPDASLVCSVGGRWCPWTTLPSQTSTARSMMFDNSRTLPGQ